MVLACGPSALAGILSSGTLIFHSATEGVSFNGGVASFTDSDASEPVSNLSSTITWGDSFTSNAVLQTLGGGLFGVSGSHTYAEEGVYNLTVNASNIGGDSVSMFGTVTVADASLTNGASFPVFGTEGLNNVNVQLATFTDSNGLAPLSDFISSIDWGDNTPFSGGTIVQNGGQFVISGSHTYAEEGSYSITIQTLDVGGSTLLTSAGASIADAPLSASASAPLVLLQGTPFSGPVATFTDSDPSGLPSDYAATIDWGDNTSSPGTILLSGGQLEVLGNHTYAQSGQFSPFVSIGDLGGSSAQVSDAATVDPTPSVPEPAPLTMMGAGLVLTLLAYVRGKGIIRGSILCRARPADAASRPYAV